MGDTYVRGGGNDKLAGYEAKWLNVHRYFNDTHTFNDAPKITRIYPPEPIGTDIRYKVDLHDTDGLIQAHFFLWSDRELVGCSSLTGQDDTVGAIVPKWKVANVDVVKFQAIGAKGNYYIYDIPADMIESESGVTYLSLLSGDQSTPNTFGLNPKNPTVVFGVEDLLKADDLCFVFINKGNVTFWLHCQIRETLHSKPVFAFKQAFALLSD